MPVTKTQYFPAAVPSALDPAHEGIEPRRAAELLPFGTVPSADGDEGCIRQVLYDMPRVARPVLAKADQPDAEQRVWQHGVHGRTSSEAENR